MQQQVYFVGTHDEVAHHAAPLKGLIAFSIVEPAEAIKKCLPGDLAIFYTEHFDRFRHAVETLKSMRVATLYMIDGILEWRNAWENRVDEPACPFAMRPVLAHKTACISHSQARTLNSWGNADKTEVVGIPRFDGLVARQRTANKFRNTSADSQKKRMLVMTAKCPAYTEKQNEALRKSLLDLKSSSESLADVEFVWRLTADLDRELGVENQLSDLSGLELAETLQGIDAVVTTPSTAAIEAMLLDVPTAILDYNNAPRYVRSAWNISSPNHLESEIKDLLNPPESKKLFQRQILAEELLLGGSAAERMAQLIGAMQSVARSALENESDLEFPAQMLPPVPSTLASTFENATFQHSEIFPEFNEFNLDDHAEIQVQLAHARREIVHLQKQLDQVQSELNQAHQIFDEINSHPIAGPIVKLRRKISGLISKLKNHSTSLASSIKNP